MNATPADIDMLRSIRGRFRDSTAHQLGAHAPGVFLCGVVPAACLIALFADGVPQWPFSGDQWACMIVSFTSPALGAVLWRSADREWEFTGDEIVARTRGRVVWSVPLASITETRVSAGPHRTVYLELFAGDRRYSMLVVPSLLQHITNKA